MSILDRVIVSSFIMNVVWCSTEVVKINMPALKRLMPDAIFTKIEDDDHHVRMGWDPRWEPKGGLPHHLKRPWIRAYCKCYEDAKDRVDFPEHVWYLANPGSEDKYYSRLPPPLE